MVLDIIESFVFIPDESVNVSYLLNHIKTQVNTLSDLNLTLRNLANQWFK